MPDWSYRTVFRPLLFRLPFTTARDFCLGFMGHLASLPLGGTLIDFLGHMRPDSRLGTDLAGLQLSSPVVLGPWLDTNLLAPAALSRFGVGMIEVGLTSASSAGAPASVIRDDNRQSLSIPASNPHTSAKSPPVARLSRAKLAAPLMLRLAPAHGSLQEVTAAIGDLARNQLLPSRHALSLATLEQAVAESWPLQEWRQHIEVVIHASAEKAAPGQPLLLVLPADADLPRALPYLRTGLEAGAGGFIIDGRITNAAGDWLVGRAALDPALTAVRRLRTELGQTMSIIAGGADDPESALQLMNAGATAVQIDAGLVFSGPGLPKRINDAVLFARGSASPSESPSQPAQHAGAMSWFWALALGIAMLFGGILAMAIACTRVVLPYDEAYLGMTAQELITKVNPRLIAFMAHDRVTLAGTMLAVGIQYVFLAWFGIRRGQHWAKMTVLLSAFAGFGTFFLFLGFGYFDPFHAFVTAILFQFLLLAFQGRLAPAEAPPYPSLCDDWRWRLAQWGQLLLIVEAVAVMAAGATISMIGSTSVFVPEDLEFMQTTAEALRTANPRLVPVVAHDRASFGGMLLAIGIATLLPALWGIRQGETWIVWMLALAGTIGYSATLAVHFEVGYTDLHHLLPALGGLALLWLALALLLPLLQPASEEHRKRWNSLLAHGK